jgi:hypothetical protein
MTCDVPILILIYAVQTSRAAHLASYPICTGVVSPGVKRPGREADQSSPSNAEVKNALSYTSTPPYIVIAWYLVKHRDNFTFTLPLSAYV